MHNIQAFWFISAFRFFFSSSFFCEFNKCYENIKNQLRGTERKIECLPTSVCVQNHSFLLEGRQQGTGTVDTHPDGVTCNFTSHIHPIYQVLDSLVVSDFSSPQVIENKWKKRKKTYQETQRERVSKKIITKQHCWAMSWTVEKKYQVEMNVKELKTDDLGAAFSKLAFFSLSIVLTDPALNYARLCCNNDIV